MNRCALGASTHQPIPVSQAKREKVAVANEAMKDIMAALLSRMTQEGRSTLNDTKLK